MIFLDTGYLLALVNPRDALNDLAIRWSAVINEPVITTEFVLVETANALAQRPGRRLFGYILNDLRRHAEILQSNPAILNQGLEDYLMFSDKDWSLTDCISFGVMKKRGIQKALAFDQHFEQAGFTALLRREP